MFNRQVKQGLVALCGGLIGAMALAAGAEFLGTWNGAWEGAGAGGHFNITLMNTGETLAGKVDVGGPAGDYTSNFSTVALDGGKLTARYDYTPDPQADVLLEGQFDGTSGTGSWTLVQDGGSDGFAAGTWTVSKK